MRVSGENPEELLLSHLEFIRGRVQQLCRRHRAPEGAAEELFGDLEVKLIANDYEVLRRFRGEAQLTTYLTVVISRFFHDWACRQWGSWRRESQGLEVSAATEEAEALIERDGFSRGEAVRIAAERHRPGSDVTRPELDDTVGAVSQRAGLRRPVELEAIAPVVACPGPSPEEQICASESQRRLREVLDEALGNLPAQDRLLVKLHFGQGLSIAAIARTLGLQQRALYTRVHRSLAALRRRLQAEGITWSVVRDHLEGMERLGGEAWDAADSAGGVLASGGGVGDPLGRGARLDPSESSSGALGALGDSRPRRNGARRARRPASFW